MVRIIQPDVPLADTLNAFLVTNLTTSQLDQFKRAFEKGAKVHLRPMLHLKIIEAPENYLNTSLAHIRTQEIEAGNTDPFVVIDDEVVEKTRETSCGIPTKLKSLLKSENMRRRRIMRSAEICRPCLVRR
jgi:hypothetical protein